MVPEHSFIFYSKQILLTERYCFLLLFSFQTRERIRRPRNQFGMALTSKLQRNLSSCSSFNFITQHFQFNLVNKIYFVIIPVLKSCAGQTK